MIPPPAGTVNPASVSQAIRSLPQLPVAEAVEPRVVAPAGATNVRAATRAAAATVIRKRRCPLVASNLRREPTRASGPHEGIRLRNLGRLRQHPDLDLA